VPGVYDVYYSWHSGSGIPRNELTRLLRRVSLSQDRDLVIGEDLALVSYGASSALRVLRRDPCV
jgi:hypothetical protein